MITLDTRYQLARGTEAEWTASGVTPELGEPIVYMPDATHASPRLKIGDGETGVDSLPFLSAPTATLISGNDYRINL